MTVPVHQYFALLARYLWPQRGRVSLLALLLFGSIGLQLFSPQLIRQFIDTAQAGLVADLLPISLLYLAQLWDDLTTYLRKQGADALLAEVNEGDPSHYRFAEKRGFMPRTHQLRAILDLQRFDERTFAAIAAQVEAMGIRLTSFAEIEQTEENICKLYEINGVAALDDPASDGAYINYENWQKVILAASWFQPAGQMIALDGDKFVGLSAITYHQEEQTGFSLISGVDAAYRNRKIMQALKLRAINYVRAKGATRVVTDVETVNAPMRAINQKFGFLEEPGKYEMEASFQS